MLYTLCYSTPSDKDREFIPSFRREHAPPFRDVNESLCIAGTLESATVCAYDGTKIVDLELFKFET